MTIQELNSRINSTNAISKKLHDERQANLGRKAALEQQLTKLLSEYNSTYGTQVTVENLQQEVSRVTALKEKELLNVEHVLALIQAGNYSEAEQFIKGMEQESSLLPVKTVATPFVSTVPMIQQDEPEAPTVSASASQVAPVTQQELPVAPPVMDAPSAPPVIDAPPAPPVAIEPPKVSKMNLTGINALAGFTQPESVVAPPPSITSPAPQPKSSITDFNSIISGTAFKP